MTGRQATINIFMAVALTALLATPALARHRHHRLDRYPYQPAPQSQSDSSNETPSTAQRNTPGQFDYYALVLSWSPAFCADGTHSDSPQCDGSSGRPFSFVLHGLWPQYQKGWPQNCQTGQRPYVPEPLINQMLDVMPAKKLIIHEYAKHGTCSGLSPEDYFALSRRLFTSIQIPQRFQNPAEPQTISPDQLLGEFRAIPKSSQT
jgi:ribonuclease T2